jgi:16S rRNA (cytosine1402-N4)-methyltransferase
MDLGVSSYQINNPEKGFRYLERNAKLDMRFDPSSVQTAADILNTASCAELYEIFSKYGEEKRSRAIAAFIVSTRTVSPIETAGNLTDLIDKSVGNGEKIATTARIFQALRIRVNDELASLRNGLADARDLLAKDGKLAVISFHSLEDRIVKLTFRQANDLIELNKKPIEATENEVRDNKRSRSAKLRIAVKI